MNNIEGEDGEIYIDPEEWLHALLALTADEEQKEQLLRKVAANTGLAFADVEEVMAVLMPLLLGMARGN